MKTFLTEMKSRKCSVKEKKKGKREREHSKEKSKQEKRVREDSVTVKRFWSVSHTWSKDNTGLDPFNEFPVNLSSSIVCTRDGQKSKKREKLNSNKFNIIGF